MKIRSRITIIAVTAFALWQPMRAAEKHNDNNTVLGQLSGSPEQMITTVPGNGDQNPYGVAVVPRFLREGGALEPGDILVSNFNDSSNVQGTGTTVVRITVAGQQSVFFQGSPGLGLTTALGVLRSGFVLVGNLPTSNNGATISPTSLLVIDRNGKLVDTLSDPDLLDGPWDLTVVDGFFFAQIFVSNVLNGTVTRLDVAPNLFSDKLTVLRKTRIASGYAFRTDPAALVVGPTGLVFDPQRDMLYVASSGDNKIFGIRHPLFTNQDQGTGAVVYQDDMHLHGPVGLALAPNGHLIVANGDAQNPGPPGTQNLLIEFTREGKFVAQFQVDSGNPGGAFGVAIAAGEDGLRFAAVDDDANTLDIWKVRKDD